MSRRGLLGLGLSAAVAPALGSGRGPAAVDLHRSLIDLAGRQEGSRRARFDAVATRADLEALQGSLRATFLELLDGLPTAGPPPPTRPVGRIQGEGYVIEKLVIETLPGYFATALLYRPDRVEGRAPGILSPCGHSPVGKAAETYQILHINLARRGYVVLTYDPVGQGERSQFWDEARGRSRFNLTCGEHAVLGNPLYLLGTNLARYRIWDGIRALDHLASLPEVDPTRIGCVGNSGGGTLTAYLAALDPRIRVPVIGCYVTALPRRMANRIEADPDADPEQDIAGFVARGIDHAGLLALLAPRPTLIASARLDFVPPEGTRATFDEARRLYRVAGVEDRIARVEAPGRHGLSRPLREATYTWFDRWLGVPGREAPKEEIAVAARTPDELLVCPQGQVALTYRSRPLLGVALEEFRKRGERPRVALRDLLRLDPDRAAFRLDRVAEGDGEGSPLILCLNGNEAADWHREEPFVRALTGRGFGLAIVDPRGVGALRPSIEIRGRSYEDPLVGVEENLAYNAFLVGESLVGIRVADLLAALAELASTAGRRPIVVCARRDAALVASLAAALDPRIDRLAVEDAWTSLLTLFEPDAPASNAASILPRLLRDFGDIPDVLAAMAPRKALIAAPRGAAGRVLPHVRGIGGRFTADPGLLLGWLSS